MNPGNVFTKLIALIMFAISFLIPGSPEKVDISVDIMTEEAQVISIEWKNNTGKAITEPTYYLERLENDEWVDVEFADGFGFPEIYTQYYPTESGKITINTARDLKAPLTDGAYRITLCYELLYSNTKNGNSSAEFVI